MFPKEVYVQRRKRLKEMLKDGLLFFPGNGDSPMNYPSNPYHFRQDSAFLYFFGLNQQGLAAMIDLDSGDDLIYGDELTIDDIIWMGEHPSIAEQAASVGVEGTRPTGKVADDLRDAIKAGRKIHILPQYRGETKIHLSELLEVEINDLNKFVSEDFIKAVVQLRSIKDDFEIKEIERAVDVAYIMHTTAMKMAFPGNYERELSGAIEGIALAHGGPVSFPIILSMNGQTLHNHYHGNELKEGRLVVTDAGAETEMGYASDITRTFPVGGRFDSRQKDIYQIVLDANMNAIQQSAPGVTNRSLHLGAARVIAEGLKELGIMKGDMDDAVEAGAHALFMPHGLGHMMGLDVHDMEGLGENYVGYDESMKRSDQFGLAALRLGRELKPGFVFTIEPGIYFIPALIDIWKEEGRNAEFINFEKLESYRDFGGVRIEDDVLITHNGHRVLGTPIPKTIKEVEDTMNG